MTLKLPDVNASPGHSLFARNNRPKQCTGQLFLEHTPICAQTPAFNSDV